ncbi:MAG TPA: rhomboid family intramembrane serine protease [Planctomycetota bacterium]|nr:rhomboid family intramembrane serine protease [Planctomycetota bacterium]
MFIPIGDDNPTERTPFVNYALIAVNIAVFLLFSLGDSDGSSAIRWAMVPADLHWQTLFTNLFLHAGWMHLIGNMWFLWIFGDNVEDRLGHLGYIAFYFVCGLAADAAHILSNPTSDVPTLGASGAISGVMGAYALFYPRQPVRTLIWFWTVYIIRTPAFIWIGLWFVQQVLLNVLTPRGSGVAYLAHIGGFIAGGALALAVKAAGKSWPSEKGGLPPQEDLPGGHRRPFLPVPDEAEIEWIDEPGDSYSVLRLDEDPAVIGQIAQVVHAVTGEDPADIAQRLVITRGMIARRIPREAAESIQRDLQGRGIPSAKILHNRANLPPPATPVEGVSWDARSLRFRSGDQIVQIPWPAPFLWIGARSEGQAFIDVFVNRRSAFRVLDARSTLLTEVDASGRTEVSRSFPDFARAILGSASGADLNEGVAIAAGQSAWGRLDFPEHSDYDDYVFWLYNLILARSSRARG